MNAAARVIEEEISSRRAEESDATVLTRLRSEFWADQVGKGLLDVPALDQDSLASATSALLSRRRTPIFLVESGDDVRGYIVGQTKIVPLAAAPVVSSIEELYVAPGFRGTQAAAMLVAEAMTDFKASGAERIQLRVLRDNVEGQKFWERCGFAVNVLVYEYGRPGAGSTVGAPAEA